MINTVKLPETLTIKKTYMYVHKEEITKLPDVIIMTTQCGYYILLFSCIAVPNKFEVNLPFLARTSRISTRKVEFIRFLIKFLEI